MAGAMDWVLTMQQEAATKETKADNKKQAHCRYADAVLNLTKAFALASASDPAAEIRDEIVFFQAVRAALGEKHGDGWQESCRTRRCTNGAAAGRGAIGWMGCCINLWNLNGDVYNTYGSGGMTSIAAILLLPPQNRPLDQ